MVTMVKSFAIQGIDGFVVDIEVKTLDGQPMISVIGLSDQAVKEAAERIHSALDESGYDFPKKKIIISLAPGDQKKRGSHFDLAMAVGLLKETELLAAKNMEQYALIGELSLNGELRACQGILSMVMSARKIQQERYAQVQVVNCNAQMSTSMIQEYCHMDKDSVAILREHCETYGYSARVIHKLLRLARTSADLDGAKEIRRDNIIKVLECRDLDKSNSKMIVIS